MKDTKDTRVIDEAVVIDSEDVMRASDLAVARGKAVVEEEKIGDRIVAEEILSGEPDDKTK